MIVKKRDWLYFDVDNTLVMWSQPENYKRSDSMIIKDPYHETMEHRLWPHKGHIKVLNMLRNRGSKIVVWSAGGVEWAQAVVDALGLEVDFVLEKPATLWDDERPDVWMPGQPRWSKP